MKLTTATYTNRDTRIDFTATKHDVVVTVSGDRRYDDVFPKLLLNESETSMTLWMKGDQLFRVIYGHRGTNSDVHGVIDELRRFA